MADILEETFSNIETKLQDQNIGKFFFHIHKYFFC